MYLTTYFGLACTFYYALAATLEEFFVSSARNNTVRSARLVGQKGANR
jgi:hypothetical protein